MEATEYIWMDGKLVKWNEAKIHVLTHTLHYGSGVFEGIRFYKTEKGPAVFRLKEHTKRLFDSAKTFDMEISYTQEEINDAILETVKKNEIEEGYIRPIAFFGYGVMGLNPKGAPVQLAIAVWPWGKYLGEKAVSIASSSYIRTHPQSTNPNAKITGNYQNSILANQEAKKNGYDEALLLDFKGNVAEGPGENIFIVKDGKLITPKLGNVLPGITRQAIIQIAGDEGIEVIEKDMKLDEVYSADEAFFSGTAAELTIIDSVDDNKIPIGPISTKLKQIYMDAVHGKIEKYKEWITKCHTL